MNLTTVVSTNVNGNSRNQIKSRSLAVIGGVALAATIAITGSGLFGQSATTAGVSAQTARPQTVAPMFATAADAEYAAQALVSVPALSNPMKAAQPMFATAADAEYAAQSLMPNALR